MERKWTHFDSFFIGLHTSVFLWGPTGFQGNSQSSYQLEWPGHPSWPIRMDAPISHTQWGLPHQILCWWVMKSKCAVLPYPSTTNWARFPVTKISVLISDTGRAKHICPKSVALETPASWTPDVLYFLFWNLSLFLSLFFEVPQYPSNEFHLWLFLLTFSKILFYCNKGPLRCYFRK
jgi:hypothetical protein